MAKFKVWMAVGAAVLLVAGCSSSKKATTTRTTSQVVSTPATTPALTDTSTAASSSSATSSAATAGLSGTWTGQYSGSFTGTFTLNWTQSGSALTGTIDLSTSGMSPINGTVSGGKINFGTVGSTAITYSGDVSGNSMSGQYSVAGGAGGTGSWSATKK